MAFCPELNLDGDRNGVNIEKVGWFPHATSALIIRRDETYRRWQKVGPRRAIATVARRYTGALVQESNCGGLSPTLTEAFQVPAFQANLRAGYNYAGTQNGIFPSRHCRMNE